MPEKHQHEWQAPPREAPAEYRKGWCDELVANGDRWVQNQPGLRNLNKNIKLLMGLDQERDLESNLLQPDIRTFVETISDLRQIATLGTRAPQYKKTVSTYNDVFKFTYWDSQFVPANRRALQWAMHGQAYIIQKWSRDKFGTGKSRIVFDALGPREGLPEQLPANNDVQGCYAFTAVRPMGIAEAHARFPWFQQWLTPISRYDWKTYGTMGMARRFDFYDRFRFGTGEQEDPAWAAKYCELRYHYIRDLRINTTGYAQQMGVPGTSWGYVVPSLGDLIVTTNPDNGLPQSRKAGVEDCRMYPQLRLIITCPSVPIPLYDDTSFDWHGEIPAVQYSWNDWAWSGTGYSAIDAVRGMEVARRDRLSDVNTVLAVRKDPPMGHDVSNGVGRDQMTKLDLLHAQGVRVGGRGDPSKWVKSLLPDSIEVDDKDFKGIELLNTSIKTALGMMDLPSMKDLKMNLSDQQVDKIVENLGPMARGISMSLWVANYKHAQMLKYNTAQYRTVDDLVGMVGPEGVGIETFDNDPNSIVPSHLPGENNNAASRYEKRDRARYFCERMNVISTPTQLLNVTHIQERMTYMMLFQKGAPLPMSKYMEIFGVDDYENLKDKYRAEQLEDATFKLEAQVAIAAKMKELGIEPPPEEGPGQGHGGGRPHSGSAPPHPELKGSQSGQVRAVNSTSK